jgi:hypothetical protein
MSIERAFGKREGRMREEKREEGVGKAFAELVFHLAFPLSSLCLSLFLPLISAY